MQARSSQSRFNSKCVPEAWLSHDNNLPTISLLIQAVPHDGILDDERSIGEVEGDRDPQTRSISWRVHSPEDVGSNNAGGGTAHGHHSHGKTFLLLTDQIVMGICPLTGDIADCAHDSNEDSCVASLDIAKPAGPGDRVSVAGAHFECGSDWQNLHANSDDIEHAVAHHEGASTAEFITAQTTYDHPEAAH